MQIVYRAGDLTEAHIVAGMLHSRGIEASVGGHYLQGAMGDIGAAGFTNVHVEDDDVFTARQIIDEYEASLMPAATMPTLGHRIESLARGLVFLIVVIALALLLKG